jgi:hypothetical protein
MDLLVLMSTPSAWDAIHIAHRTTRTRSLAFRMLSRAACGCYLLLRMPHDGFPFTLFDFLDENPPTAEAVAQEKRCFRDDFAEWYLTTFLGREDGPEGLAVLRMVAEMAAVDVAEAECGHGYWQREARAKSLQTVAETMTDCSATWSLHKQRASEEKLITKAPAPVGRRPNPRKPRPKKATGDDAPGPRRKKKRVRKRKGQLPTDTREAVRYGGGGAYRVFLRMKLKGKRGFGPKFTKSLNRLYRELKRAGGEEYEDLLKMGQAATRARAFGVGPAAPSASVPRDRRDDAQPLPELSLVPISAAEQLAGRQPFELEQVLALADGQWAKVDLTHLRRTLRAVSRSCRDNDHKLSLALSRWEAERSANVKEFSGADDRELFNVRPVPSVPGFKQYRWCPPAVRVTEHVMKSIGDPQSRHPGENDEADPMHNLHPRLRKAWVDRHRVVRHEECPQLGRVGPTKFTASPCRHLCMCICGPENKDLASFRLSVISLLQVLHKKAKLNPYKALVESARCILHLQFFQPDEDPEVDAVGSNRWYHIAYTNQNSWACSFMQLYPDPDSINQRRARARGNIALRAALRGTVLDAGLDACDRPFAALGVECVPRNFHDVDFRLQCKGSVYEIVEDDTEVLEFLPACLEVRACECRPVILWPVTVEKLAAAAEGLGGPPGDGGAGGGRVS